MSDQSVKSSIDDTLKRVFRDYTEALLIAIIIAILLRIFLVSAYKIPTSSMSPTLKIGDFVLAIKWPYGWRVPFSEGKRFGFAMPKRGDVAVFSCPYNARSSCVKRIVGLPGDRIQLRGKNLIINGKLAAYSQQKFEVSDVDAQSVVLQESIFTRSHNIRIGPSKLTANYGPVVVPPDHFFVLADSRDASEDSRTWGALPMNDLQAKVFWVWMSLDWSETWKRGGWPNVRWHRLFHRVN